MASSGNGGGDGVSTVHGVFVSFVGFDRFSCSFGGNSCSSMIGHWHVDCLTFGRAIKGGLCTTFRLVDIGVIWIRKRRARK